MALLVERAEAWQHAGSVRPGRIRTNFRPDTSAEFPIEHGDNTPIDFLGERRSRQHSEGIPTLYTTFAFTCCYFFAPSLRLAAGGGTVARRSGSFKFATRADVRHVPP